MPAKTDEAGPKARLANYYVVRVAYQLVPEQPPALPPLTVHERVVTPAAVLSMVNRLPDFDFATIV
jgi:hypothetical protein